MPTRFRSLLLALALGAIVFVCTASAPLRVEVAPPAQPPARSVALATKERLKRQPRVASPRQSLGRRAASIALEAVGVPYRWGGASLESGFDCSGLVSWAYRRLGIELPHSSYALYDEARRVARSRMKPGDLLFFYGLGHVGLYVGRGRMVHAPQSGRRVEVVELKGSYYGRGLVSVRRLLPASL